jgi:hypothetical protein
MWFLRYWLPGIVCFVGVVWGALVGGVQGLDVAVALVAAGSSIWLMNFLMRLGITGDRERDEEEAARAYFDEHGEWPDDPPPKQRQWTLPAGVVTAGAEEPAPAAQRTDRVQRQVGRGDTTRGQND